MANFVAIAILREGDNTFVDHVSIHNLFDEALNKLLQIYDPLIDFSTLITPTSSQELQLILDELCHIMIFVKNKSVHWKMVAVGYSPCMEFFVIPIAQ